MKLTIALNNFLLVPLNELGVGGAGGAGPGPVDMRRTTRNIGNNFVSDNSSNQPTSHMQAFILLFDYGHQDIINPAFLPQMIAQEEADGQNYRVQLAPPRPRCHQAISG
jgi:hypothetical protein